MVGEGDGQKIHRNYVPEVLEAPEAPRVIQRQGGWGMGNRRGRGLAIPQK